MSCSLLFRSLWLVILVRDRDGGYRPRPFLPLSLLQAAGSVSGNRLAARTRFCFTAISELLLLETDPMLEIGSG